MELLDDGADESGCGHGSEAGEEGVLNGVNWARLVLGVEVPGPDDLGDDDEACLSEPHGRPEPEVHDNIPSVVDPGRLDELAFDDEAVVACAAVAAVVVAPIRVRGAKTARSEARNLEKLLRTSPLHDTATFVPTWCRTGSTHSHTVNRQCRTPRQWI